MDRIAAGEMTKGAVVGESRDLLHKTWTEIDASREDLAKVIWKGMDEDRILGPCKVCEEAGRKKEDGSPHMLRIIRAKKSGKRFVGCSGWTLDDPEFLRPDLPAAPARRRLQARRPLLDLRRDAAAQSRALPRPALEPLPQRRLRVDAGDEETAGRARSGESGESSDGEEAADRWATRTLPRSRKKRKSKLPKLTPRRAGANAPKPRPKAEACGVVHLARGSRRLGQEHPGAAAGRGAGPGDGRDPRAGRDRRRRADPRAARRPGLRDRPLRRAAALLRRPRRPRQPRHPPGPGGRQGRRRRPLRRLQRRLPGRRPRARHQPRALAHRHRHRRPLARPHPAAARSIPRSASAGPRATTASRPRASTCSAPSPRPTRRSRSSPATESSSSTRPAASRRSTSG